MDGMVKLAAVIVLVGAINFLARLSFIEFFATRAMPPLLARALRFVPPAMLAALVVPMVLSPSLAGTVAGDQPAHARGDRGGCRRVLHAQHAQDARRRHADPLGAGVGDARGARLTGRRTAVV